MNARAWLAPLRPLAALLSLTFVVATLGPVPPAAAASTNILTENAFVTGSEIGLWLNDGGPALLNSTVTSEYQALKSKAVRYGVYDCPVDMTCGTDNHPGTLSKSAFATTVSGIVNKLHAVPWIKLPPVARGAVGSVSKGSVFCPPATGTTGVNWSMNLAMDEEWVQAISTVYKGPLILEDNNEAEYDCYAAWGFDSAGAPGVSTDLGHMWSATMPALKAYALSLGFSQVVTVGYIGINGGPGWGQSCTYNTAYKYSYSCAVSNRWIDEFNNQVLSDYNAATSNKSYYVPDVESVHSYCHSADFAPNPFAFDDNECYAYQYDQIVNFRRRVDSIWGSTIGPGIRFAVSEWQAGTCTDLTSNCWSGLAGSGNEPGAYDDGYLSMLQGNGKTTGTASTAWWGAALFEVASNNNSSPDGSYNIIGQDGTKPAWYSNVKTSFARIQRSNPCTMSEDSSTPAAVRSSPYGSSSVSTAAFTPPAGSLLEVMVTTLQGSQPGGAAVRVTDSSHDTFTAGPSVDGSLSPEGVFFFQHYLPSSPGTITVTATQTSGYVGSIQLAVRVVDNAAPVQNGAASGSVDYTGTSTDNLYSALNTTQQRSWAYVAIGEGDSGTSALTPPSNVTGIDTWYDTNSGDVGAMGRQTAATGTPGAEDLGWASSVPVRYVWAAQEILPASC